MHVHEINPKRTLITIILFLLVIIFGWITMKQPRFTYELTPQQTLDMALTHQGYFHPYELEKIINKKDGNAVLIDIRNSFDFARGHIPGAINITATNMLDEKNIERLNNWKKNGVKVVFYHDDQLQANGSWMFFRQIGYDNVKILLGGYNYYNAHKDNLMASQNHQSYLKGKARYDFAKVAAKNGSTADKSTVKTKKPVVKRRKKKAVVASGGC